jgi:hypothetical protein
VRLVDELQEGVNQHIVLGDVSRMAMHCVSIQRIDVQCPLTLQSLLDLQRALVVVMRLQSVDDGQQLSLELPQPLQLPQIVEIMEVGL